MDINEFKSLVLPVKEKLYKLAVMMLKNAEDAEDALQEVFLKLWNIKHKLAGVDNIEAYAMRMTKNLCIDKLKAVKNISPISKHEYHLEYTEATPYKRMELTDSVNHMQQILDQLPEQQKEVIYMRDVEDYSFEEIAEITGLRINAIRTTLSRARKNARVLYLKLNDYEIN